MGIVKLKKLGEDFIRSKCNGTGNSKLQGSALDKRGVILPYCNPKTLVSKLWISNPDINRGVRTNQELAGKLIGWFNKYAEIYELDANIMAAQLYQESAYIVWNYAGNSSASGISQFVAGTMYDVIMKNKNGQFTNAERQAISKNMIDYTFQPTITPPSLPFLADNSTGHQNRPILHQNIIDNPEIMIKAQYVFMKSLANSSNGNASCTLFRYNRGLLITKTTSSYTELIYAASKQPPAGGKPYQDEGIDYVFKIFTNLYNNFGYAELNMTKEAAMSFDSFNANIA